MATLSLRGIEKWFGALKMIKGVDLEIADKEFVVFVGPSGCGKSTLLRMIAGLETVSGGELQIGGRRVNDLDCSQRGISMVFQSYALYPHLTVRQNMGFALRFAGIPRDEIKARVEQSAETLGLGSLLERYPKQLSGGQRQRVAIGRAIVRQPEVFLFDEPLSNLDAELRVHMRIELARLHKKLQTTIIYVTHDQVEAMTLADRIVVLRDGIIEQQGSPLELYDDPNNIFVAGFIGSPKMNLLAARIEQNGVRLEAFPDHLLPAPKQALEGQKITVGIRPEHFRSTGELVVSAVADVVEQLGGETFVYGRGDNSETIVFGAHGDRTIAAEQRYEARFDPACLLYFDASGQRLR